MRWALVAAIWAALGLGGLVAWYAWDLPDPTALEAPTRRASVTLRAADGAVIATYGDLYGAPVGFADLPPHLVQAVVAIEDRRFFSHGGYDPLALLRAVWVNLRAGTVRQGGSTITQQLAKNLFLEPDRTLRRKVQELLLALWLEARFTKAQIFTLYANRVYLGGGAYGVTAAARRYFGKPVGRLDLHEAAVLAGLLKAPSRYAPSADPDAARRRAAQVLAAMADAGFITPERAEKTAHAPIAFAASAAGSGGRYFADWVLERLAGYVGRGGRDLVVRTTLDPALQRRAEEAVAHALEADGARLGVGQGAAVALAPDGAVLAMVGGRDYAESQFNRATQALRQPGSAFKLAVYLAGLEAGLTPDTRLVDAPIDIAGWQPRNYDGRFHGAVTLREAFARSLNSVAVRVSERAGRSKVIAAAQRLGITAPLERHPSLALGVDEVTPIELTAAYAVIANGGAPAWPYGIREIRDGDGKLLYRRSGRAAGAVVNARTVAALRDMLRAVVAWGTGKAARVPGAAGKTGTSQDFRDAWFVGFDDRFVAGVWVGNDDGTPMHRVTGGGLPARIWREIMRAKLTGQPAPRGGPPRRAGIIPTSR